MDATTSATGTRTATGVDGGLHPDLLHPDQKPGPDEVAAAGPVPASKDGLPGKPPPPMPAIGMTRRLRRQATPHAIVGALMLAASAARIAETATGDTATVAMATAAIATVVAIIGGFRKRIRLAARTHGRGWALGATGAAILWLTVVAATGITWEATACLLVGGWGAALRYWRHHRIPNPTPPVPVHIPAPAVIPALLAAWRATVSCRDGALPGAMLTDREVVGAGERYLLHLVPGKQTLDNLLTALPRIATGLRCDVADFVIETIPGDSASVHLSILTASPIKDTIEFNGPVDVGPGRVGIGLWADGSGDATYQLYTENSMWGGVVIGGVGSGKSELLLALGISVMSRGDTTICYADGQYGASCPELIDKAHWAAPGPERSLEMLRSLANVVMWRSRQNVAKRWRGFTPSAERPGILAIVDECHMVFENDEAKGLAEYIARVGRKVGVALLVASQYSGLKTFGGSEPLRGQLMQGNIIALRTANRGEKHMLTGLDLDPATLPELPGYGYLAAAGGAASGKTAPFRGRRVRDADTWIDSYTQLDFDNLARVAAGECYTDRHNRSEAELMLFAEAVEAMERGEEPLLPFSPDASITHPVAATPVDPGQYAKVIQLPRLGLPKITDFINLPADPGAAAVTEPATPGGLTDAQARLLAVIAAGAHRPSDQERATTWSDSYCYRLRNELVAKGLVDNPRHGHWEVTTAQVAA